MVMFGAPSPVRVPSQTDAMAIMLETRVEKLERRVDECIGKVKHLLNISHRQQSSPTRQEVRRKKISHNKGQPTGGDLPVGWRQVEATGAQQGGRVAGQNAAVLFENIHTLQLIDWRPSSSLRPALL